MSQSRWAYSRPNLSASEKSVLAYLASHNFPSSKMFFSIAKIVAATSLNKKTVHQSISSLVAATHLTVKNRRNSNGTKTTNAYILNIPQSDVDNYVTEYESYIHVPKTDHPCTENGPTLDPKTDHHINDNLNDNLRHIGQSDADAPPLSDNLSKVKQVISCPHESIIQLYLDILPMGAGVDKKRWQGRRKKFLEARWKESREHRSLDFWKALFEFIATSSFLKELLTESKYDSFTSGLISSEVVAVSCANIVIEKRAVTAKEIFFIII